MIKELNWNFIFKLIILYPQYINKLSIDNKNIFLEYPSPEIDDLDGLKHFKINLSKKASSTGFDYLGISQMDIINIHLVPEKKGLFLKYSEYIVTSKRFNVKVTRRYNDFVALKELLLNRFPYR